MPIGIVGDIHGFIELLHKMVKETVPYDNIPCVIQVGDFGVNPVELARWKSKSYSFAKPTYFVDGNHEYFSHLLAFNEVTELVPNLFYVPRGSVLKLDGRVVAFLGGAASIDKAWQGSSWDWRENITEADVLKLWDNLNKMGNPKVDLFVTHAPPLSVVNKNFDAKQKLGFGVPITWTDPNMIVVETLWEQLGKPDMVCGHMHRSVKFAENSYIMAINEFRTV